jgi:hypothetical protein
MLALGSSLSCWTDSVRASCEGTGFGSDADAVAIALPATERDAAVMDDECNSDEANAAVMDDALPAADLEREGPMADPVRAALASGCVMWSEDMPTEDHQKVFDAGYRTLNRFATVVEQQGWKQESDG